MNAITGMPDPVIASASPDEAGAEEFLSQVESRLNRGERSIKIDCAPLIRVASSHINALWRARDRCDATGATMELINVGHGLRRVLEVLDLTEAFFSEPSAPAGLDLQFDPTVTGIDDAMARVIGFLIKSDVPEITAFELQTLFYEITTNIRCHGRLQPGDKITSEVRIDGQTVDIIFGDDGIGFDPTCRIEDVDGREAGRNLQRNGFGLAMIQRLSDSMKYSRTAEGRNRLNVKKSW